MRYRPNDASGVMPGAVFSSQRPKPQIITVDELSNDIRATVAAAPSLRNVSVRGELQNFKRHTSGHVFFTLAGESSRIDGVMFNSRAANVISWPRDGDEVLVTGSIEVYVKNGKCQIYAVRIMPIGAGAISRARDELRARLEAEGLFDIRHKRPLPRYPHDIVVITSETGAALQDILRVSEQRFPSANITLIPALVQGVNAPESIARAFALVSSVDCADSVILARGGGAQDDLSPFDDERVVRAIRSCPLPVVAGVGHQINKSLADLAADAEAPTPSAAAELLFPDRRETIAYLDMMMRAMSSCAVRKLEEMSAAVDIFSDRLDMDISNILTSSTDRLDGCAELIMRAMNDRLARCDEALSYAASRLDALSPLSVLARGYAVCSDDSGEPVRSVDDVSCGDAIAVRVSDGIINAEVVSTTSA